LISRASLLKALLMSPAPATVVSMCKIPKIWLVGSGDDDIFLYHFLLEGITLELLLLLANIGVYGRAVWGQR
jgi:hypothetical protein